MSEIGVAYVQIRPTAQGISGEIEKELGGAGANAGEKAGNSFAKGFGKIVAGAAVAGTAAVSAFAKSAISAGSDFDASMSQVAATMGTTVDEISDLRSFAQEMGSTTAFSATEAADALNYMALAGYDAQTSMQMLPNVLNLAAAGGIDLASASDMITDASSALGLSLSETTAMVDQMAKASSISNTSVAQLGEAMLTIGATARNVSGGTTELSAVLGALADNGIKGAEGGTHLRNIILSLQNPTKDGAAALEQLGVAVYDADGNMRSIIDIIGDLNAGMGDMDQASKDAIVSGIFNKADLASVNALLGTSSDRFAELESSINGAKGAAQAMAETQLDNLEGDVTLFKSALEGAQIALSDQLTPTLRDFVQFGAEGLGTLTQAFNENGIDGAMDALGTLLADGLNMIIEKLPAVIEAGMKLVSALGQGILQNLPTILQSAISIIMELAQGLISAIPDLIPAITDIIIQIALMLTEPDMLVQLLDAAIQIILALAEGLIEAVPKLIEAIPQIIENLIVAILDGLPLVLEAGGKLVVTLAQGLLKEVGALINAAKDLWERLKNVFKEKIGDVGKWGKDLIDNFIGGIKAKWEDFKNTISDLAQTVKDFLGFSEPEEGPLSNFHTFAPDMMRLFEQGIEENTPELEAQISKSFNFRPLIEGQSFGVADNATGEEQPVPVVVEIALQGDADTLFTAIQKKNQIYKKQNGESAFA